MQGIGVAAGHFGGSALVAVCAVLVVVSGLGSLTAWMASNARLPFAVGLDSYLPKSFGWIHPRWRTPVVSLAVQSLIAAVLVVFGQSGTSVKGAYDVLVGSTVLGTMVPFILMFAAGMKLGKGKPWIVLASAIGLCTVVAAMILSAFPSSDATDKALAVMKVVGLNVVMVAVGALFYALFRPRTNLPQPLPAGE
jgi:amino acid transporter